MAYFNAEYSKHNNTHKTLKFELQINMGITSNAFENKLSLYDGFHMCDMSNST